MSKEFIKELNSKKHIQQNREVMKHFDLAKESDGYLIMITTLNGDNLNHTAITSHFRTGDLIPSLIEYSKQLEKQVVENTGKEPVKVEPKKIEEVTVEEKKPKAPKKTKKAKVELVDIPVRGL